MTLTLAQLEQSIKSLARQLQGDVYVDRYHRSLYSTDASLYQIQPLAVVVPRTGQDTVAAVRWAVENQVSIVPRGGGTSLSGQSIGAGLVIDFSKYQNLILNIDPDKATARVQPGVVLDHINQAAAQHGLQFGPDVATSSRANLGGMLGNNSAGARSIRNGKMVDHVISLDVLLSDGTPAHLEPLTRAQVEEKQQGDSLEARIYRGVDQVVRDNRDEVLARYPKVLRRVSGYNLDAFLPESRTWYPPPPAVQQVRRIQAQRFPNADFNLASLIVGAEGTLATVTEMLVHLVPLPKERGIVVLHFKSLEEACEALAATLACEPSAVEFFDKLIIQLAAKSLEYRNYLDFVVGEPESLILVEFSGDTAREVQDRIDQLTHKLRGQSGLYHVLTAMDAQQRDHIWACRKAALPLLMGIPGTRKPVAFVEDTAVDTAKVPQFVRRFREILHRNGTDGAFYGHFSVGCLHIRPLIDAANREDLARLERIANEVCDLVLEFGGSMSGEHGDGLARSFLNEKLFGPQVYRAFKDVKSVFDPHNLLNPGKVVDGPSPIENLRYGVGYETMDVETELDFSGQGGFAQSVELCNGSALCRKLNTGTMCPSFMAAGDEEHSTRGRANALRLVLSGALPPEELTGPSLYKTFDLCLQCKGCKAECPSNVDVAKMKVEFLHHYYEKNGTPLGVRAMGNAAVLNRLGSAFAPLSNWMLKLPGAAWLNEKLLGVDRRRPMPRFYRQHFARWFKKRPRPSADASRGQVVLLDDCLTSYCEPQVNRAAAEVLERAGFEVVLAGLDCCGRALLSKGLVRDAKQLARQNVQQLLPFAEAGIPILGSEPSCILTLVDDYLDMDLGEPAEKVAAASHMVDAFLAETGVELPWGDDGRAVVLHGHCHQKALVGTGGTVAALEMVPGTEVQLLDSGCCGMAGSFGYEHYEMSMQIGERVLFPAVREASDAEIVAPGFSCRHQIQHGTSRRALHPMEYLAGKLK